MGQGGSQNPRTPTGAPGGANQPVLPGGVQATGGGPEVIKAYGNSGVATTLTLAPGVDGNAQTVSNSASCTYTMPSGLDATKCIRFILKVTNGGAFTATFTGVKWAGGTPPVLSSGAAKEDAFEFTTFDGGTTWYGVVLWQAAA